MNFLENGNIARQILNGTYGKEAVNTNKPKLSKDDYFFHEWLILNEKVTLEQYENMSGNEYMNLYKKWLKWKETATEIKL